MDFLKTGVTILSKYPRKTGGNHNWQSIDTHVDLLNQIIYGEMAGSYNDLIILHVPEGTIGNFTVAFREDNGESRELKGSNFELTTDNLTAVLGSRCVFVKTE